MGTPSTSTSRAPSVVVDWGRTAYADAHERQHALVERRLAGGIPDTLVLTEHDPVITLGRGAHPGNVLLSSAPVVPVERGGDVTWHGPGQLVGYWIRLLPPDARDLVAHMRALEDLVIAAVATFGVHAVRVPGCTGVWVERAGRCAKLASLGVAARRWCTYHGFALNVDCDLSSFRAINPCGFDASVMTSLADILGSSPGLDAVKAAVRAAYGVATPQVGGHSR